MKTIQVTDDDIVELTHILIVAKNVNNRMENESKNDGKRAYDLIRNAVCLPRARTGYDVGENAKHF